VPYATKQDFTAILRSFKIDASIVVDEYREQDFTGEILYRYQKQKSQNEYGCFAKTS
jgi:hypothetical protein